MPSMYLLLSAAIAASASARTLLPRQDSVASCPGYSASNVQTSATGITADLALAGLACNSYGKDIENLRLTVNYDTGR